MIATGLLLAVAYQQTVATQPEAATTRHSLAQDVQQRQAETDAQQKQAEQLRQQAASLRDAIVGPNSTALDQIEARAGLGAVTGDGVTVTLASGPAPTDPVTGKAQSTDQGHIVDFDLQVISNELWHDGAEAIAINGQRLIATSTIRAAGNAILVDLAPLSEPYTIQAIGPSSMADALRKSAVGGFYSYLATSYGVKFAVRSADGLRLAAAADPGLRYATPVTPSSPGATPPQSSSPKPAPSGPRSHGSGSTAPTPPASEASTRDSVPGRPLMFAVLAMIVGIVLGVVLEPTVPVALQPYLPIAVVAALDAVFGGIRARLDGIFDDKQFVISFVSNVLVAALIVYLGDQLGVGGQLSTGVVVVLGVRIFGNVAAIRRHLFRA